MLFTDLPGGSCCTGASASRARNAQELAVVTGVNLAMLLDFVFHRDLSLADAAPARAVEIGREARSRRRRRPAA